MLNAAKVPVKVLYVTFETNNQEPGPRDTIELTDAGVTLQDVVITVLSSFPPNCVEVVGAAPNVRFVLTLPLPLLVFHYKNVDEIHFYTLIHVIRKLTR